VRIYYINLESQPQRRERIEWQLAELGLKATRIRATTPADIAPDLIARYCPGLGARPFSSPELACTLSHMHALQLIADSADQFGLVLEDDAILSRSFAAFLRRFENLSPRVDLLKLDSYDPTQPVRILKRPAPVVEGIELSEVLTKRLGTSGYIVDRVAARKIAETKGVLGRPIDLTFYFPTSAAIRGLRIRHAVPALCVQPDNFEESTLHLPRTALRAANLGARGMLYKLLKRIEQEHLSIHKTVREVVCGGASKRSIPVKSDLFWGRSDIPNLR
jgi:glycosyl transferase family 25